uniref:Protein kinase domain-containing protein n=1 Tax=Strongyloides papillosus TaxID=174720 RepID=A0A0N5BBT8_STREA
MIHWDIKPLGIFIDACNNVKIGDFCLATIDVNGRRNQVQGGEDLTQDVGTALYTAPELHADSGYKESQILQR